MLWEVRHVEIPFRFQYGHARKQHRGVEAIVCRVQDDVGNFGVGEAVPRDYVTGETCQSVMQTIESVIQDVSSTAVEPSAPLAELIRKRVEYASCDPRPFPSCAMCAVDLALSDLQARREQRSLAAWLGSTSTVAEPYCASIGLARGWKGRLKLSALLLLYRQAGFQRFKVKVGAADDESRIRWIRSKLGSDVEIFADANAAWDRETAIRRIEALAAAGIWAMEEPLKFRQASKSSCGRVAVDRLATIDDEHLANVAWVRERSPIPLIADESLICLTSLERVLQTNAFDILNIRLSKCGGPLLAMHMLQRAVQAERRFAVAAMVGESPVLATAGSHFAAAARPTGRGPIYVQGFSHRLLHRRRFADGEPKLKRGRVILGSRPGLGLAIDLQKLDSITKQQCPIQT